MKLLLTQPGVEDLFYSIFAEHSLILLLNKKITLPRILSLKKHLFHFLIAKNVGERKSTSHFNDLKTFYSAVSFLQLEL